MYLVADSLTYLHMSTTLRCTPPGPGWPLRKWSAMTLVEVSQHAFVRFWLCQVHICSASSVLQCTPGIIFPSTILCWINPSSVMSNQKQNVSFNWFQMLTKAILFNTLRSKQNGRHFPDDMFKCIFLHETVWISIKISLGLSLRFQLTIFHHWFR